MLSGLAALAGCFMLAWILWTVITQGIGGMNWDFFTQLPTPVGVDGGGLANAIVGTILMTALATLVGVPVGMLAGVYLSEFARGSHMANAVRFGANTLLGVPSIIIGVFVYTIMIGPMGHFSGFGGAVALAIIMFPVVLRTTEEMLLLVPNSLREAALAMGAPRWRVTFGVLFPAARNGLLTGALLAIARVSGEPAPLLFTSLNNDFWTRFNSPAGFFHSFNGPTANLTVTIFEWAAQPDDNRQKAAWAASLLITAGVLLLTILSRWILRARNQ